MTSKGKSNEIKRGKMDWVLSQIVDMILESQSNQFEMSKTLTKRKLEKSLMIYLTNIKCTKDDTDIKDNKIVSYLSLYNQVDYRRRLKVACREPK